MWSGCCFLDFAHLGQIESHFVSILSPKDGIEGGIDCRSWWQGRNRIKHGEWWRRLQTVIERFLFKRGRSWWQRDPSSPLRCFSTAVCSTPTSEEAYTCIRWHSCGVTSLKGADPAVAVATRAQLWQLTLHCTKREPSSQVVFWKLLPPTRGVLQLSSHGFLVRITSLAMESISSEKKSPIVNQASSMHWWYYLFCWWIFLDILDESPSTHPGKFTTFQPWVSGKDHIPESPWHGFSSENNPLM